MKGTSNASLTAESIEYNSGTVKDKLDGLSTDVSSRVLKSGDTMSGNLYINRPNGTTSANGTSYLIVGNDIPQGTQGNSAGRIWMYGTNSSYTQLLSSASDTNSTIYFPDKAGTIALTSDLPQDSGWVTSQAGVVICRKIGLQCYVARSAATITIPARAWTAIDTLPVGYGPTSALTIGLDETGSALIIRTDGTVELYTTVANFVPAIYVSFLTY